MDLPAYLESANVRAADLARVAGCHRSQITRICKGGGRPSPRLALAIEAATGGAVSRAELLPDVYPDGVSLGRAA